MSRLARVAVLPADDRRYNRRRLVNFEAKARELGGTALEVVVLNLTEHGCCLSGVSIEVGRELWLKIDGFEAIRAQVVWADGDRAGCEFHHKLAVVGLRSF